MRHTQKNIAAAKIAARIRKDKVTRLFKKILRIVWKPRVKNHKFERFFAHLSGDSKEYYIKMNNRSRAHKHWNHHYYSENSNEEIHTRTTRPR